MTVDDTWSDEGESLEMGVLNNYGFYGAGIEEIDVKY